MMTVFEANSLLIIIAVVIGFVIGLWMFKRVRGSGKPIRDDRPAGALDAPETGPPPQLVRTYEPVGKRPIRDGVDTVESKVEGRGIVDEGAAAASDVTGELLGVQVHRELPGASGPPDDLQTLKGVGPKLATKLNENGIIRFDQLAKLSPNEVAILDDKLGPFKGRLQRDRVVEQASYLARGDRDGFEARFGKLGGAA